MNNFATTYQKERAWAGVRDYKKLYGIIIRIFEQKPELKFRVQGTIISNDKCHFNLREGSLSDQCNEGGEYKLLDLIEALIVKMT